jgi:hypothetical protein
VPSSSVLTLGPSPSFGPSVEFPKSTFPSSALLVPSSLELLASSVLSLLGISLGLGCLFSWGVSSFDSSYKHKERPIKTIEDLKENRVRK